MECQESKKALTVSLPAWGNVSTTGGKLLATARKSWQSFPAFTQHIRRIETKHMSVGLLAYYFVAHALRIPMSDLLAEGESGDHRLEEMNAAWHSILHEHDRHVIYVTFMAMISAIEDIQDKKL